MSAPGVTTIVDALAAYDFDAIHGAFPDRSILRGGKAALKYSADRYLGWIKGDGSAEEK